MAHHKKVCDKLIYLVLRAFTSASVCAEPLIHKSRTRSERERCQGSDKFKETRGDVIIQGLWDRNSDAIIYVKLGDSDADSYKYDTMPALMDWWETIKNCKHSKYFHYQGKHSSPFALSVDDIKGRESLAILAQLSQTMAEKMDETILHVQGWKTIESQSQLQDINLL